MKLDSVTELLREIPRVRQIRGEPRRRWFSAFDLDLIVWLDDSNHPWGFQFCHGTGGSEHALTWRPQKGFDYSRVDSGEHGRVGYKSTPILLVNGTPNLKELRLLFESAAGAIPQDIRSFVVRAFASPPPKPMPSRKRAAKPSTRKRR